MGFLMHFRPFSVKTKNMIFPIFFLRFRRFLRFFDRFFFFFTICLILGFPPPPPPKTPDSLRVPHCRFILKIGKKLEKIGFPMTTPKNRFQILNLHPKKHIFKTIPFFMYFCLSNTMLGFCAVRSCV